jgi:hypothetical protein
MGKVKVAFIRPAATSSRKPKPVSFISERPSLSTLFLARQVDSVTSAQLCIYSAHSACLSFVPKRTGFGTAARMAARFNKTHSRFAKQRDFICPARPEQGKHFLRILFRSATRSTSVFEALPVIESPFSYRVCWLVTATTASCKGRQTMIGCIAQ